MTGFRVPAATYRLQFHHGFRFITAQALVPYLHELGISEIYASPFFQARRRSPHGYSVTNPLEINPELGSRLALQALVRALKSRNMGLLLDIVPNHMALSHDNPWWLDVLENGPASPFARFFDIDWHSHNRILEGKVLQPILGAPFGQVLENQELRLSLAEEGFSLHYYEHKFPLDPKTYPSILTHRFDALKEELGPEDPAILTLTGLITLAEYLPPRTVKGAKRLKERRQQKEILKKNLWLSYQANPAIKKFLDANLADINGQRGVPESFNLLERLLDRQAYRLAYWRVALDMINYRRFFSINDLIGIRVEDPQVFEASHSLLLTLIRREKITGLRIDHIDGLYDPLEYLQRLQSRLAGEEKTPGRAENFYVVVEKILEEDEALPREWPVAGTTGYDFLDQANGLLVDPRGLKKLKRLYASFVPGSQTLPDLVYDKKILIMETLFGGEVASLAHDLALLAEQDRQARDLSRIDLRAALVEVVAGLPRYRTYIRNFEVREEDEAAIEQAVTRARERHPALHPPALEFLRRVLLLQLPLSWSEDQRREALHFVRRWQQFTGPIMAKGLEDTALYNYNPLVSLNEVGGSFRAVSPAAFHEFNLTRLAAWPLALNATSTHDTKRSEDVRARLQVLAEMPEEWGECLNRWHRWNLPKKTKVDGESVPDANQEILLYQTLLGAWPLEPEEIPEFKERVKAYLIKAAREAKVHTRWISPNLAHEQALLAFLEKILEDSPVNEFFRDFQRLQARLAFCGAFNSLSQVLLKIAAPGVPDFYQGTELWDFSLVDPDNRRPVDFQLRAQLLKDLKKKEAQGLIPLIQELLREWQSGAVKLFLTAKALNFRKAHLDLFLQGDYLPLSAKGSKREHVVAFARRREKAWVLAVVGRFFHTLAPPEALPLGPGVWQEGRLNLPPEAPPDWLNVFTGESLAAPRSHSLRSLALREIFQHLPIALLWGKSP
ncbi:MAG: malto-oligosyltrehalose synthase [Thermodesulfobacteriota bacterium]